MEQLTRAVGTLGCSPLALRKCQGAASAPDSLGTDSKGGPACLTAAGASLDSCVVWFLFGFGWSKRCCSP